jgi:hypothetical protein
MGGMSGDRTHHWQMCYGYGIDDRQGEITDATSMIITTKQDEAFGRKRMMTWLAPYTANKQPIRPTRIHIPPSPTKRQNPLPPNPPRSPSRRRSPRMGPNTTTLPITPNQLLIPRSNLFFRTGKPINNPPKSRIYP